MWQFVFWLCLGAVAYTYVGYPLTLFVLTRIARATRRNEPLHDSGEWPSVCFIISAFNEEKVIRKKIENSLALDYPKDRLTLLVASDGCDDDTCRIVSDYEDMGVELFRMPDRAGKSATLNAVAQQIDEEIIVFTDANSIFDPKAIANIVRRFHDPAIGCVVGKLRYVEGEDSSVGKGESAYWKYECMLSMMESELRSVLVANGSIFGIRRALFPQLYPDIANDFQIPVEIGSEGHGVVYEPTAVAYERTTAVWQEEFQRKVRIVLRGLTGFSRMRRRFFGLRLWQFVSHKLVRWCIGPFLFVAMLANVKLVGQSAFYTTAFVLQLAFYLAAINGWRLRRTSKPHPVFYIPFYFTMVNLAAVMAMAKFISGERQAVWEKAESARYAPVVPSTVPSNTIAFRPRVKKAALAGKRLGTVPTEKVAKS